MRRAAEWIATQFKQLGLATELIETAGHPLVYAESPPVPGKPVALVYGHYDVQPPEPLDEWISPPFEPTVRDGNIYARGATDDKGQMLTHVKSVEAWIKTVGKLPLQVKFLIEGEEEVGSEHLGAVRASESREAGLRLRRHQRLLPVRARRAGDHVRPARHRLLRAAAARAAAGFALRHVRRRRDEPGQRAGRRCSPRSRTRTAASRCPAFTTTSCRSPTASARSFARCRSPTTSSWSSSASTALSGEAGYTSLERRWARPTCDINGLTSGYQGEGAKTVLPARASAKFSFRLVPNQDPHKIAASLRKFLEERLPPGIEMELIDHHGAPGVVVPLDSPYMHAAAAAIEAGFGRAPVLHPRRRLDSDREHVRRELGADVLLLGWGQNDDNTHSPNEKFSLDDYHRGTLASAACGKNWQTSHQARMQRRIHHRGHRGHERKYNEDR